MFLILLAIITVFVFYLKKKKNENYWQHLLAIPGPKAVPVFGTEFQNFKTTEAVFEHDKKMSELYYPIFKRYGVGLQVVTIVNPEDTELILSNKKHIEKSEFYNFLHDWLGSGLLTSKGQHWHKRRKILTPAFHFNILQEFMDVFNKETNQLVENLKIMSQRSAVIDVIKPITEFTLYSIGETSFGKDLRDDPKCAEYKQAVYDYGENLIYRATRPWLFVPLFYKMSSLSERTAKTVAVLHNFSNNIIKERYNVLKTASYAQRKKLALLDLMIQAKQSGEDIDDVGIREEVDTFILGGHDTTAVTICHTLMALANEQEIQEEMYQEIVSLVEDPNNPSFAELGELKYVERCIKESLRLYPSGPGISRIAGEDVKTHTGYTIPKGCNVLLDIYGMHRRPELYEDSEKFNPDRFLPENIAKRHPYSYIPFSAGSRNCIGQKYAMLELKAALCGILANFKLNPVTKPSDLRHKADIVLRPSGEIKVKFVLRN